VPRFWENEVNATVEAAVRTYPNVLLINWHKAIEHHTDLLWSDGIHPMAIGGKLYAKVVRSAVLRALARHLPPHRLRAVPLPVQRGGSRFWIRAVYACGRDRQRCRG